MRQNQYGQPIGDALPHWQPAGMPGHTLLPGRFCRLEPLDLERWGDELYRAYQTAEDDRDWTYLFWQRPQTREDFQHYLQAQVSGADRNTMVVIDQANGRAVGTCAFLRIDPANGAAELGTINWSPLMKRSALGSEAIFLMLRHLFDDLGYRRCEWKCDSLNLPSRQAAERLGFRYEGTFRQAVVVKGRTRDTDWLSIIDAEWPARHAAFAAWLSPGNIGNDGRQERRLQAFQLG
ncbi:GNAT family N-acetyltransferase [Serratia marcescens]|uniref:RimJ/RimL family protein N-acetyltransferase n=2 Tax=Serratia TaxID=613 RepID=A0AA46Q933_SERMA|nr:GNAT family protein [Serratia marcescens]TQI83710.1 RimJ/RimL family protein N-acetyltransferase [Serratia marcescens]BEM33696.1 N-acetyltransferase [Serratia marcescens]BEM43913.1 N-acetyltransferase [Serratia marcescens]BEM72905.1 N-acetyltransferase [Serratia marcescens]